MSEKIKVAVITEYHPVDMINFHQLFWSFEDCECYIQSLDMLAADEENNEKYDVLVFYNLSMTLLPDDNLVKRYLTERLGNTRQGIILLHHAICCYPGWDLWKELSGVTDRKFKYHWNQEVVYQPADKTSPILDGIETWTMVDETYTMDEPDYGENQPLLTTNHPNSMNTIAWVRTYRNARVFCYESGHDKLAYENASFRKVLHNAIRWCGNKV